MLVAFMTVVLWLAVVMMVSLLATAMEMAKANTVLIGMMTMVALMAISASPPQRAITELMMVAVVIMMVAVVIMMVAVVIMMVAVVIMMLTMTTTTMCRAQ
jgi:hypothetical protein